MVAEGASGAGKERVMEMELIVISEAKLKVMLTAEDVRRYELSGRTIDGESPETRRLLRGLLDEVKSKTGFDASGERVLVQLYPSRGGGCELFVTKLGKIGAEEQERGSAARRETALCELRTAVFSFSSAGAMLAVCRRLFNVGYALLSAAYADERGGFWLVLQENARRGELPSKLAFVEEFGQRRRGAGELSYIKEHGRCIVPSDAVGRLGRLA